MPVPEPRGLDGVVHFAEEVVVVLDGIVDDLLAAMDELESDAELLVGPPEEGGRDLDLWEGAVKHDSSRYQGQMSPLSEHHLAAQVVIMMLIEP